METIWNLGIFGAGGTHQEGPHPCYPICGAGGIISQDQQVCEICGTARQSHGNLFEDRVAAYICLEMSNQNQEVAVRLWREWKMMTSGAGARDIYDIDFGSGTPEKCKAMGCISHFPSLEKSKTGQQILEAMHAKYGRGISVKVTGTGAAKTAAMCAIDMGDACRISTEMDAGPPGWSLIVGQWAKMTDTAGRKCKCIIKVYQLTKITSAVRGILYGQVATPCIDTFVAKYYKQGAAAPTVGPYTKHKDAFRADRKALGCNLALGPKSNKRCQCTISSALFVKFMAALNASGGAVPGAHAAQLSSAHFPHLFKPIYRESDQGGGRRRKTRRRKRRRKKTKRHRRKCTRRHRR